MKTYKIGWRIEESQLFTPSPARKIEIGKNGIFQVFLQI